MAEMRRAVKDSVFTCLFGQPEYAFQLYQVLHPEDTTATVDELQIVTLENILVNGLYNDLGILMRGRAIILAEAQSTFCRNMPLRGMMYLSDSYKRYVTKHELSLYAEAPISIPRPELYMLYTGEKKTLPDVLRLSDLYGGGPGCVDVEVRVLRTGDSGNILDQYAQFCTISSQQVRLYGQTEQAAVETIRICQERNVLSAFLESRKEEVVGIMTMLFDQEKVWEIERRNVAKEAEKKGMEKGIEKGMEKGMELNLLANLKALMEKLGYTAEQAMDTLSVPAEARVRLQGQL